MAKLTKRAIDGFKYSGGWDVRWDDALPGFGVRIYPTGRKSYVLSYRAAGRKRLVVIGNCNAMTLFQARDRAQRLSLDVRDGRDPVEERKLAAVRGSSFDDLAKAYLDQHAKIRKRSWQEDERRLRMHIPRGWRRRQVKAITRSDVAALHIEIGATRPYEANRLLALLHIMFRLAKRWGYLDATAPNPAGEIEKFREHKRKRWVTPDELPELAKAIDAEPSHYVRAALWLYLLIGVRKRELLAARRSDVDWNRGILHLRETKSGEEQSVPLSGPALAILQSLPKDADNPFLIPGAKAGHHLVNIEKPWRRIRAAAGVPDVTLHDLRRTVGSWMSQFGIELNTIRDALRHADLATTLVYTQLGADPARQALEDHGARIMRAAGKPLAVAKGATST